MSVYFCQHAHWLCISCFFSKFSEVCSSNKHQLLIELASPIVFYFNGDSLQGSAAYSLHCSAQCSYVAPCHTSPFTEAVTFISMKRINRSESRVCSAFGGVECKLKASQGCNVGNAEKSMMHFHPWGDEVLGFTPGIKEEFHSLPINIMWQSYIERMQKASPQKLRKTSLRLSVQTSFSIFCDCITKQPSSYRIHRCFGRSCFYFTPTEGSAYPKTSPLFLKVLAWSNQSYPLPPHSLP